MSYTRGATALASFHVFVGVLLCPACADVFPVQTEQQQEEGFGAFGDHSVNDKKGLKRYQNSSKTARVSSLRGQLQF